MEKLKLQLAIVIAGLGSLWLVGCYSAQPKATSQHPEPQYRTVVLRPAQTVEVPMYVPPEGELLFLKQPESQTVLLGSSATFSVSAGKIHPFTTNGVTYQWQVNTVQLNGDHHFTNSPGQTNWVLLVPSANTNDVGYYRAIVRWGTTLTKTSSPAPLVLVITNASDTNYDPTVLGLPAVNPPAAPYTACGPTNYAGYVYYPDNPNSTPNPPGGWGFIPVRQSLPGTATDPNGHWVEGQDVLLQGHGGIGWCASNGALTIPGPRNAPGYFFVLFFLPGQTVPTGPYAINLVYFTQ
jgi:hypothetical protein